MNNQTNSTKKSKRTRSPDYPHYTLGDCIGFLNLYINNNGFVEAHKDVASESMGHSPTSSTSNRVVAAMMHYGLFEVRGSGDDRFFWPSVLAGEIYKASRQSAEYIEAIRKAALAPDAMKTVWEKWGENLPTPQALEKSLLVELGFSRLGAERFSTVATENYQYANLKGSGKIQDTQKVESAPVDTTKGEPEMTTNPIGTDTGEKPTEQTVDFPKGLKVYRIPVDNIRDFHFAAPADITESEFDDVVEMLKFFKKKLTANN